MRDIVTGVRDAEASVRVLERALSEARTSHRPLRVITVWSSPILVGDLSGMGYAGAYVDPTNGDRTAKEVADGLLEKALSEGPADVPVKTTTEGQAGDPGHVLTDAAKEAALLVVGGRGHGAVASALLGSATGHVLHHAPCPVMVVPSSTSPGPFLRVIVGMDSSACSRSALRWAHDAAARHQCPLLVVHTLSELPIPAPNTIYPDYDSTARSWLQEEIDEVLPDRRGVEVLSEIVSGPTSRTLLEKAGPDDLLVLGSRGRGGFVDLVLGSVATQCTTHARGAVVVVHAGQDRLDAS